MDVNLVVMAGTLAAPTEHRRFESGTRLLRCLVTVRTDEPRRRVDVVPVTWWDPADDSDVIEAVRGDRVWVAGAVQRRFWAAPDGRRSRLEVVAHHIQLTDEEVPGFGIDLPGTASEPGRAPAQDGAAAAAET